MHEKMRTVASFIRDNKLAPDLGRRVRTLEHGFEEGAKCVRTVRCCGRQMLFVGNNKIADVKEVNRLVELPELEELVLFGNPYYFNMVSKEGELAYAAQVMQILPNVIVKNLES